MLWTPLVLALALALPASTAAGGSGYSYRVIYNYCSGYQVNFKVKNIAAGWTPANYLTIDSWAQRKINGRWQTVYTWNQAWYSFNANGQKHTLTSNRQYNGNSSYFFRIVMRLRAWQNNNLLATKTLHSVKC
jgi:hypothetical protein